jgi:hypothetical protein
MIVHSGRDIARVRKRRANTVPKLQSRSWRLGTRKFLFKSLKAKAAEFFGDPEMKMRLVKTKIASQ